MTTFLSFSSDSQKGEFFFDENILIDVGKDIMLLCFIYI